jgi:hypothetical protein
VSACSQCTNGALAPGAPGGPCANDEGCIDVNAAGNGICGACTTDSQCCPGETCREGACVDACTVCDGSCLGACVDVNGAGNGVCGPCSTDDDCCGGVCLGGICGSG